MKAASIIGMGWVTPLGRDLVSVWTALKENKKPEPMLLQSPMDGRSIPILRVPEGAVRDASSFPRLRRSSTISHLAVAAALDAVAAARLIPEALKRTALVFTASDGGVVYTRKFYAEIVERGEGAGSPLSFLKLFTMPRQATLRHAWDSRAKCSLSLAMPPRASPPSKRAVNCFARAKPISA